MDRALKIIESLKLPSIVFVFDQAIYSKAIEIKCKEKQKFNNCVFNDGDVPHVDDVHAHPQQTIFSSWIT